MLHDSNSDQLNFKLFSLFNTKERVDAPFFLLFSRPSYTFPLPLFIVISHTEATSRGEQSRQLPELNRGALSFCSSPHNTALLAVAMQTHPAFICKLGNISYFEVQINVPTPQKRHRLGFLCKQYRVNPPRLDPQ